MKTIIIDTDIGDDADDVLALALAIKETEIHIAGITTVFKDTRARAQIARYFLSLVKHEEIPVGVGKGSPLKNQVDINELPCQFLPAMEKISVPEETAQDIFKKVLTQQPATLVCIGPLTNIATLITQDPELLGNVQEIVMMGGCYHQPGNEWNIVCDPEAAEIVFKSGLPLRCIGLDVTKDCHLSQDYLDKIDLSSPLNSFLRTMCQKWFDKTGYTPILHDPLTIYALLENNSLCFRPEQVAVELTGQYTRGMTVCGDYRVWGREPDHANASTAYQVDHNNFVKYYFDKVFK